MSDWFVYALVSGLFAGLHTFALKVSVERKYDTLLLSALSSFTSLVLGGVLVTFTTGWGGVPLSIYGFGLIGGVLFTIFTLTRLEGLKYLDSAIFFPLYKVIGPAIVAVLAILLLNEDVGPMEVVGIVLSCLVPLLLITRAENKRQKNLKLGLILMTVATVVSAVSSIVNAYAMTDMVAMALPLATLSNGLAGVCSVILFLRKHPRTELYHQTRPHLTRPFLIMCVSNGFFQIASSFALFLAFGYGDASIAYSVTAHYILIPVLLSVWIYKEHWNIQKAAALVISIIALIMLH